MSDDRVRCPVTVVALLDKQYPPYHSFVDGMLSGALAAERGVRVWLVVSRDQDAAPRRYLRAGCWPRLMRRRGFGRVGNMILVIVVGRRLLKSAYQRNRAAVLFVRNDPLLLVGAALLARRNVRLVFQSSFPHERLAGRTKAGIARLCYRVAARAVDAVTAVSAVGLDRVRRVFPNATDAEVIPLLADAPARHAENALGSKHGDSSSIEFVYIGSHAAERDLPTVLMGIERAVERGLDARFRFIGGSTDDIGKLRREPHVRRLEREHRIEFCEAVPRPALAALLERADVGLSVIPPIETYRESSPTKVAEYMALGIAVLASRGIATQESMIAESGGGMLVDWSVDAIAEGLIRIGSDRRTLEHMKQVALHYAATRLQYGMYLEAMLRITAISTCMPPAEHGPRGS